MTTNADGKTRLFIYGTLKRGHCRHFALSGQQFLGEVQTAVGYRLYDCGEYPGLVRDPAGISISGELWAVDEECLARLDEIECVEVGLFKRGTIQLKPPHQGEQVETYFYCGNVAALTDCGSFWPQPCPGRT